MKILFISAASSIHTVRWVNALEEKGQEVILVSLFDHKNMDKNISNKVRVIYLPHSGTKGYYLNALLLKKIFKKENPDVINVHYASGYGTLARMAKLPNIILNVWGSDVYDFPYESKIKEKILKKNLKYAKKILSTSYSMAEQTRKFISNEKQIEVVPFGVDIDKFKAKNMKEKEEIFVFGTVKTLLPKYGIDTIIRAFDLFCKSLSENEKQKVRLEIYGGGEMENELRKIIQKRSLEKYVLLKGYIVNSQVSNVLNKMDVFLLGSRLDSESFGVAAVEAMACELPIIATKVSGFKEVIEENKTGFLVPVDDIKKMASYMKILYRDNELREIMGKYGRRRVASLYNWDKNVEKMISEYKNTEMR